MKITAVEIIPQTFQLSQPSVVSYAAMEEVLNLIIRIETQDGMTGWGCCAPDPVVTGETIEGVQVFLENCVRSLLLGQDALRISALDALLVEKGELFPAARAGVNMALYDLLGKKAGMPVYQLLGACRDRIPTSVTINLDRPRVMAERAKESVGKGFGILKLKIGGEAEEDVERVIRVREAVGYSIPLRLDANQAYSLREALAVIPQLVDLDIEMLEQPTPAQDWEALKALHKRSAIPIMADESVVSLEDACRLVREDAAGLLNVKLMKSGGLTGAMKYQAIAEAAGVPVMVGCMDESVISIAAGLHLALACCNAQYADLDGHLDLVNDVADGGVRLEQGMLYPLEQPGFGLDVRC